MFLNALTMCAIITLFIMSKLGINLTNFEIFGLPLVLRYLFYTFDEIHEVVTHQKRERRKKELFKQVKEYNVNLNEILKKVSDDLSNEFYKNNTAFDEDDGG